MSDAAKSLVPFMPAFDGRRPFCEICQKGVDEAGWETPIETAHSYTGAMVSRHTGEIIITVKCHGETFAVSNWRGILSGR